METKDSSKHNRSSSRNANILRTRTRKHYLLSLVIYIKKTTRPEPISMLRTVNYIPKTPRTEHCAQNYREVCSTYRKISYYNLDNGAQKAYAYYTRKKKEVSASGKATNLEVSSLNLGSVTQWTEWGLKCCPVVLR
jgi:hypothetical protein